ncbi:hypothetical protein CKAH01_13142 [Colletotrichum kahawae]|uniref:AB hydrolase-1 domain-containing protein n=1 Tax=Colletotrichum kahawae TaxID=34407 RepID=A0AAD9YP70_COLKA|nr:hypothetical protein CKAH01_13142 [Colletotrichum kahawae]
MLVSSILLTLAVAAQAVPPSSYTYTTALRSSSPLLSTSGFSEPEQHVTHDGSALCVSGIVPVAAAATNIKFDFPLPANQSQVTQAIVSQWSSGVSFPNSITAGSHSVNGTYNIGATLCLPQGKRTGKIQVLTHGIGFDRRYWDLAPDYSYVDNAVAAGYAVFYYDRLGVGSSSKEDPITTVQSLLELEILAELVRKLRDGCFSDHKFSTVVGVGHSFGSALTQGITATYPSLLDAAVLTGFTVNGSGMPGFSLGQNPAIAATNQPSRFGNLSTGYLVIDSMISTQTTFFHHPGFDSRLLVLADAIKSTVTLGEFFTTKLTAKMATVFSRPLALVSGNEDLGFCSENCSYPIDLLAETAKALYPKIPSNMIETYSVPLTGHGLNLHYSAGRTFKFIHEFLERQGV